MPYVTNPTDEVRIHYEVVGDGPPLVMLHGSALSAQMWHVLGYVEPLSRRNRLILPDARGHGRSDKPLDSAAYTLERIVSDLVAILDHEQIDRAGFFGYSMGGRTGFGIGSYAPERFNALILGGASYSPAGLVLDRATFEGATATIRAEGIPAFLNAWEAQRSAALPAPVRDVYLGNDRDALVAYLDATAGEGSMQASLLRMTMPVLFFAGEHDPVCAEESQRAAARLSDGRFVSISGENHASTIISSDKVLPVVQQFLAEHEPGRRQPVEMTSDV